MKQRVLNLLIAIDQLFYVLITLGHGSPDETLSAACWRWEVAGKTRGKVLRPLIDTLFFFDYQHCFNAFQAEQQRHQLPKEYRL
jgi:hypothetical protein